MSRILKILTVSMVGLLLPTHLKAQKTTLTLQEAVSEGLSNNFDIIISDAQTEIAANNNTWGQAGRYPTVNITVVQNNNLNVRDNPTSFVNGKITNNGLTGTVEAGWIIFNGFRVNITKERLEILEEQSNMNASLVVENTLQAIVLGYYRCIVNEQQLDILENLMRLSRRKWDYTESKRALGLVSSFDALQFKGSYLSDSAQYITQKVNYENSKRNLNLLLGRPVDAVFECADELTTELPDYSLDSLKSRLARNNLTLRNQFINQELLRTNLQLERTNLYPSLRLNVGTSGNTSRLNVEQFGSSIASQYDFYANFTLNFTLFNGGKVRTAIENAQINDEISLIQTSEITLSLDNELGRQYALYEARKQLLELSEQQIDIAAASLSLADERYAAGTLSSLDYRDVQLRLANAQLSQTQALLNTLEAHTELVRLSGGMLSSFSGN